MDGISLELQNKVMPACVLNTKNPQNKTVFCGVHFIYFFSTTVSFLPVTILTKNKAYHIILCFWIKVTLH